MIISGSKKLLWKTLKWPNVWTNFKEEKLEKKFVLSKPIFFNNLKTFTYNVLITSKKEEKEEIVLKFVTLLVQPIIQLHVMIWCFDLRKKTWTLVCYLLSAISIFLQTKMFKSIFLLIHFLKDDSDFHKLQRRL